MQKKSYSITNDLVFILLIQLTPGFIIFPNAFFPFTVLIVNCQAVIKHICINI